MLDLKIYKTNNLVLKVNQNYNHSELGLLQWDRFLDVLCGDRNYQKEAIIDVVIYLGSKRYKSIEDLVLENWSINPNIQERYRDVSEYNKSIQLPNKLSATIDLATGTGKSYVIYGVAQIMLGLGLVDKVLVLCPSLTIEKSLTEKFVSLSADSRLIQAIPDDSIYRNPRIINSNVTIRDGDICVENVHAVYSSVHNSISHSLIDDGQRVLILNDEVHHVYNKVSGNDSVSKSIKKWKEFLMSPIYNFKYIIGFTGTAYINDDYFNDIIYRYSLRQAVNDRVVKMVDYVVKDESNSRDEKLQEIYNNHSDNKEKYNRLKPLTILICKDINNARRLQEVILDFLCKKERIDKDIARQKVTLVTSHRDHKDNVAQLDYVDDANNSVEWIVSVSMLTEGWDVKNVFQIVPWEDRAFNSKLLIAQVLGRGLRIPDEYQNPQPRVIVFNHDAWSKNIKGLVNEILEIEVKLTSSILETGFRSQYNFALYNIDYEKIPKEKEASKDTQEFDYSKGYIELLAQVEINDKNTEYESIGGSVFSKKTTIEYETFTINEVVDKIYYELQAREWEGKILQLPNAKYSKHNLPPKEEIRDIIINSMKRRGITGDFLVEKNRQKILQAFGTLLRKRGKTIVNIRKALMPYMVETREMRRENLSIGNLRRNSSLFLSDDYRNEVNTDSVPLIEEILDDQSLPRSAVRGINKYLFKTPLNIVFAHGEPERKFIELLCKHENTECLTAWVKSRDQGFYGIEYSWRKSQHPKQHSFNPDFFIKTNDEVIVVIEIKADNDVSDENKAKLVWGKRHFDLLNTELMVSSIPQRYIFHFLSPCSYAEFFKYLNDGRLAEGKFRSDLEDQLDAF